MNPFTVPTRPSIRKVAPLAFLLLAFPLLIAMFCLGTPTPVQAATIEKCGSINSDETWTSGNVYVITCDVTVNNGVTLTVQAGTVVKFKYFDLNIDGTLDVQGTASNRVVFTSFKDDSYGGDTNEDGTATTPAAGNWGSIQIFNSANTLDYTLIQYGGGHLNGGVYIADSSPTVEHNLIRNNKYGIYVENGSPTIKDNDIEGSSLYGLRVNNGSATVSDNTFTDSGILHLYHGANADPAYSGNTFSGTGGGAINVYGGSISDDITWENIQGLNWPYLVSSDLPINNSGTLTVTNSTIEGNCGPHSSTDRVTGR